MVALSALHGMPNMFDFFSTLSKKYIVHKNVSVFLYSFVAILVGRDWSGRELCQQLLGHTECVNLIISFGISVYFSSDLE